MDTSLERWRRQFRFSRIDPSEYLVIRRHDEELLGRVERHGAWWAAYTVERLRIDRIQYTSRCSAADALERHHHDTG